MFPQLPEKRGAKKQQRRQISNHQSPLAAAKFVQFFALTIIMMMSLLKVTECSPIVTGYLNPWEIPFRHHQQSGVVALRDPMPWEDGYFDPSYHAWPKSGRGQQVAANDKQQLSASKLMTTGDESASQQQQLQQQANGGHVQRSIAKNLAS